MGKFKLAVFNLNQFQDKLRISSYRLRLNESVISSRAASGLLYRASYGPRIWTGDIQLTPYYSDDYRELDSLISQIQLPHNFFIFSPKKRSHPKNFSGEDFSSVAVRTKATVGVVLQLKNVPPSFTFVPGDMISFEILGAHRLYEIAAPSTANPSGFVNLTLTTPLTNGALPDADTPVSVVNPKITCAYDPGSTGGGTEFIDVHEGYYFSFVQALRT